MVRAQLVIYLLLLVFIVLVYCRFISDSGRSHSSWEFQNGQWKKKSKYGRREKCSFKEDCKLIVGRKEEVLELVGEWIWITYSWKMYPHWPIPQPSLKWDSLIDFWSFCQEILPPEAGSILFHFFLVFPWWEWHPFILQNFGWAPYLLQLSSVDRSHRTPGSA